MAGHSEDFLGGSKGETNYRYEFEEWKEEAKTDWKESIDESDLTNAESVKVKIENTETGGVAYNTLTGPFDSWEIIGEICEDNWGPDGYEELR